MKAKFGMIVVAGSGKIGGHVASRNKGGAYFRTKVTPVNKQSSYQTVVRALFTTISQAWRGLTENERKAWNDAVGSFQKTNIFGDSVSPSGFTLFQRLNNNIISIGGTLITDVPTPLSLDSYTNLVVTASSTTNTISLAFTAVAGEDSGFKVLATPPMSPSISFVKNQFRVIQDSDNAGTTPLSITTAYIARYGSIGVAGQKIWVKIIPVGNSTGVQGIGEQASAIVAPTA